MTNTFSYPTLQDADLQGKKVLLRAGFDVPIENGLVVDTSRIEALLPTFQFILDAGASLILMAHQGRPKAERVPEMSQQPLVPVLSDMLGRDVKFAETCTGEDAKALAAQLQSAEVLLLENLRYESAEKSKKEEERDAFGKELAALADVYVNDAFTNCHRDHASMTSVPKYIPGYVGLHLANEIQHIKHIAEDPKRPTTLIISGAKMETKVPVIEHFLDKGDDVLLGGLIANTFIAARGFDMGSSRFEEGWVEKAQELMLLSEQENNAMIHVPRDAVVAEDGEVGSPKIDIPIEDVEGDMCIFDVGAVTAKRYQEVIENSGTVVWNGPLGMYENESFAGASKLVAQSVAKAAANEAITIIGGGDTIDFHTRYHISMDDYTWVSMGGGALLEFISGKKLPALEVLKK